MGNRGLAQKLVGAGAAVGHALHAAARGGHEEIANDLLENGASIAAKEPCFGHTPLHCAAQEGTPEMVQLLLLKRADKDALDNFECTPLYVASLFGNVAAALALMAAGADVSLRCGHSETSVVHKAAQEGHVDIMRAAIELGADVVAADTNQVTPLHRAAPYDQVEAIDVLVEAGANIDARDDEGCTPLHRAVYQPCLAASLALLKLGADVNAQNNDKKTPLHWVADMTGKGLGYAEIVDSLLRSGADETLLDNEGKAAADRIGGLIGEEHQMAEDVDRVRELLADAPADRAWRRRGYLVLCRAHPGRMHQSRESSSAHADVQRITRRRAKQGKTEAGGCSEAVEALPVDGWGGGNWSAVLARLLGLQEEGIFRTIVGYL